ncbi:MULTISPECIES: M16 family metallopeptidase [Roseomonadaceae]|uniref:Insulinase family protein n=1 Tax=Falsiroseomonas oleicola TaxID=2801474 RepID=A0ABS6HCN8_9PROT|nr:pitrilysin family protein [Roseomonas oleicola]MBU8546438.1 insulinase family protein [Roseomonas oleicola]
MTSTFSVAIQQVTAPGGQTAWLIEDHSVPVVSLAWGWGGGAALDAPEHGGALAMGAALLTEGAGDLDMVGFADALRDSAIGLGFSAQRDGFEGSLRALLPALPEAVRLANLAMRAPRLEAEAMTRVRGRAVAGARAALETPRGQVGRAFWAAAFPGHPAGRPTAGTVETLSTLPEQAIRDALARQIRAGGVLVAASGAITAAQLSALLPALFEGLPADAPASAPPLPAFTAFAPVVLQVPSPQSAIQFGQAGMPINDPDWEAFQVVLRILAGGGFTSRLMEAVRVQRGLAYGIGAGLDTLFGQSVVVGSSATDNARVAETLEVTRAEWARMAAEGPQVAELEDAVAFLTGNLPLQFTDTRRIAATLLAMQRNQRPIDWLDRRDERLRALTRDGTAAVAARLLRPDGLAVAVAGQPAGL